MLEIYLIKNKLKKIKKKNIFIRGFLNYSKYKKKLSVIKNKIKDPNIWKDFDNLLILNKKKTKIKNLILSLDNLNQEIIDINELINLAIDTNDKKILQESRKILFDIQNKINNLEFKKIFIKKNDKKNCFIDIQSGSGGIESQDWAKIIMKMYLKWAEKKNFQVKIISESPGEIIGIKSSTLHIIGDYAFGWLRTENGIHRLVRKSPFSSSGRRHTSFASTFIYPEIKEDNNIFINSEDLRIDVYRSSGSGGQHVNRTESAVRITHNPTGLVTQCQNSRSQHKNKIQAIKQLKFKLYELQNNIKKKKKEKMEKKKFNISWGYQIRSYILDDSRIKDLRTGVEINNIQYVLNGNLDKFIEASLKLGL
ncbi:peptide chain release factor 2 [Enterobacteriaceae endosymbiont of Donacia bicoloricornis]|uniref:peptide chain release factor 2 n=1 Tax=Enterobacteriaceae endosymbiont of Donacia bicoloricornis TaxID=2675772 RepID=UPI001448FAB4|nr:peptide chain release factor 2 [Enterobacteriaceae endosymbiont of Donacia bicoloricornis]QJC37723.1 peptide chain release factor 2 [Enterobacteriaceae endosymbiont of Donacia bicoloricornis]